MHIYLGYRGERIWGAKKVMDNQRGEEREDRGGKDRSTQEGELAVLGLTPTVLNMKSFSASKEVLRTILTFASLVRCLWLLLRPF